jgi:hypothetical protein
MDYFKRIFDFTKDGFLFFIFWPIKKFIIFIICSVIEGISFILHEVSGFMTGLLMLSLAVYTTYIWWGVISDLGFIGFAVGLVLFFITIPLAPLYVGSQGDWEPVFYIFCGVILFCLLGVVYGFSKMIYDGFSEITYDGIIIREQKEAEEKRERRKTRELKLDSKYPNEKVDYNKPSSS